MNITRGNPNKPARHTILIVDDNPANLEVVGNYLAKSGLQVMGARDGETGLQLARQGQPDLILLDVVLPGIDGFEVCRRLKADERTREIPVIFMTILTRVEDKVKGFEVGVVDYIAKPFQEQEVLARVTNHLCLRDLTRQLQETKESLEKRVAERTAELAQANRDLQAEIAERERVEESLRESGARYQSLFEDSPISLWEQDFSAVKRQIEVLRQQGVSDFRAFFESHPEIVAECISLVELTDMNKAGLEMYEASSKADLATGLEQIIPPHAHHHFIEELVWIAEGKTEYEWESINTTLSGKQIEINLRWSAVPGYEDTLSKVLVSIVDITERKQTERALAEQHHLLRTLIDNIPDAIYVKDVESRFLVANERVARTMGATPEELIGKRDVDYYPPDLARQYYADEQAILESGQALIGKEEPNIDSAGTQRWLSTTKAPFRDSEGKIKGIVGVGRDITQRKEMEQALRRAHDELEARVERRTAELKKANEQLAALYQMTQTITAQLQLDEVLGAIARSTANLLGTDTGVILLLDQAGETLSIKGAHGLSKTVVENTRDRVGESIAGRVVQTGQPIIANDLPNDPRFYNPSTAQEGLLACASVPLVVGGKIIGTLDVHSKTKRYAFDNEHIQILALLASQAAIAIENARLYEQTLQSQAQAEAANRAKSAFLANMSHELRTPLNAILGYAQILQRRPLEPDVIDNLRTVQRSGEHLLTLINDILDIAKIEAGKTELYPTEIHFHAFLDGIASIIRARAKAKNLTFTFETLNVLPAAVRADETRLRQVLLNLLDNAVQFTDEGEVVLSVVPQGGFAQVCESGGEALPPPCQASPWEHTATLRFSVRDTGIGIPPDQVERIFLPFEQVTDMTRQTKGTGLGLAISHHLVELMGSELHVESPPSEGGPGSIFWFDVTLPVTEIVEAAGPPEHDITGYKGPRRAVLVVDDVPSNRAVLVDLLGPLGFDVVEAAEGQQAIHLARELQPDLILMDRWMPVLDGFEATQQLRQIPELEGVTIIAVSASVSKEDQAQSREAGIDAFLPKPVNWADLAALLGEHLGLEWEYEEEIEMGRVRGEEDEAVLVPPPQEELAILHHLALRGNMQAIQEHAAHVETLGEQYVPFARRLRELAQGFEERAILALARQYMKGDE